MPFLSRRSSNNPDGSSRLAKGMVAGAIPFLRSTSTGLRLFVQSRPALAALIFGGAIMAAAMFAPLVTIHDPTDTSLRERLIPPVWQSGGTWSFPLGTDQLGRDVLTRVIYGARSSLRVALSATLMGLGLGTTLGLLAGMRGGVVDATLMRLADIMFAIPLLILAIVMFAIAGPGVNKLVFFLGVWGWAFFARVLRGQVLKVKKNEYILAARAVGVSGLRLSLRHILPNSYVPVLTLASVFVPLLIVVEGALSFLGMGVPDPDPSWGNMIAQGRDRLDSSWWLSVVPGVAMAVTVLAFNIIGDRLRETVDPRLRI